MNKEKILNFFDENEKFYKKEISNDKLIFIIIIGFLILIDLNKFYKIKSLQKNIFERKLELNCKEKNQENCSLSKDMLKLTSILNLMEYNEIKDIEIKNNKLKIKGEITDVDQIKKYMDPINKLENIQKPNIDYINNIENLYEFEISTFLGLSNENQ